MACFIELCFVSLLYINGGLGVQDQNLYAASHSTNHYGLMIGELSVVAEMGDHWYIEAKHISGLNTQELDGGMNAVMLGARINLWDNSK